MTLADNRGVAFHTFHTFHTMWYTIGLNGRDQEDVIANALWPTDETTDAQYLCHKRKRNK